MFFGNACGRSREISGPADSVRFGGIISELARITDTIFRWRGPKCHAESVIEIREVAEARVQRDAQRRLAGGSETHGRFAQPHSQKELVWREANDLFEGSQEVVGADPDERAQFFKAQWRLLQKISARRVGLALSESSRKT